MKDVYKLLAAVSISWLVLWLYPAGPPPDRPMWPINRDDLKIKLVNAGVIDAEQVKPEQMSELNLLWAFGLGNKNEILETGPMTDPRYGGAHNFASTGGWTLSRGPAMDHYSRHQFITLTPEQQALVSRVSQNIYRPCCNNPTYFPDCNHGMAMLGLLELMTSAGASEADIWRAALAANARWFPDHYRVIAAYLEDQSRDGQTAPPQELLGVAYSSAAGYRRIASQVTAPQRWSEGGGC